MSSRKQQSPDYAHLHRAVLERDGWRCQLCGSITNLNVHHQVFRSRGGTDSQDNLVTLCAFCHRNLHDRQSI